MAAGPPVGVAVVGCGTISDQYLRNLTSFPDLRVLFCADLDLERAKAQADKYGVPGAGSTAQAIAHPEVELVVNLTIPAAHAEVTRQAVALGKSVWVEKPLTLDTAAGRELLAEAAQAGVRIGCAPDTVLGAGLQTARRLISEGAIGAPQTALALMQDPGPERWHPDPEFLFRPGAGPLYDMGPYYLTALASVFGPVVSVAALGRRSRDQRVIGRGPRAGTRFEVAVPTYVASLLSYADGGAASVLLSFDSPLRRHGFVEITGTEATLAMPDPNGFDGEVRIRRRAAPSGRPSRPPGPPRAAASAPWTWPARCAPVCRTGPPATWPCTCWTPWRPWPARWPGVRSSRYGPRSRCPTGCPRAGTRRPAP